ncbi:MAG: TonB-dependent receptor [Ignavibacteriales bacterium]|nr:TonB-dependent receptor [Ignavibacteriales bacterium]
MKRIFAANVVVGFYLISPISVAGASFLGTHGILEGRILDKETRRPLVAVNVFVMETNYGGATDTEGYYQINNIRAGVYNVRFSMIGYKTVVMRNVTILPDLRTRIDMEMEEAVIELETIEVRAEKPLIQKDLGATAYSIGELKIEKLPISSFREVVLLQPGTTLEGNIRGGKTTEILYMVDGLPVQDVVAGGLGASLPRSAITGMTVTTGGFEAEYGNAMSGVVNVVTKGGTNKTILSGRFERDDWIPEAWNKQQDRAMEAEFTAGGPIVRDRLYYFTANTVTASDTRWWQDFDKFFASPITQEFSGFGKIEGVFSQNIRMALQGLYSAREWRDYEFSWRFNLAGLPPRDRHAYRVAGILTVTLSDQTYFTATGSFYSLRSRIGDGPKESMKLSPFEYDFFLRYITAGTRNWWADTQQRMYTAKGDITHHIERMHLVKLGFEVNQYDIMSDVLKYEPQITYFGKPIPTAPLLSFSNRYNYQPVTASAYIQDKIELVRDGSNISLGLRWDYFDPEAERPLVEFVPIAQDEYRQEVVGTQRSRKKSQWSPRVSAALPFGESSFFFLNLGQYFQIPLFEYLYSGITPAQLHGAARSVLTGNPDLEPERVVAVETGIKQGLSPNVVVSVTYFRKSFKNQIDSKTLIPFDSKSAGDFGFASYVNNSQANASGIEIVLSRERDERLSGSLSYSYMTTEGVSEAAAQGLQYAQWGFPVATRPFPLSWDQRHTIKADAEFHVWERIQANLVLLYNSPRPYTYYPTRDGFTPLDSTKVFVPNNKRMEDVLIVNAKLTRDFVAGEPGDVRFSVFIDIRNVLNRRNVRWIDSSGRIGGELGDPGAYYDPRRIRIGIRADF